MLLTFAHQELPEPARDHGVALKATVSYMRVGLGGYKADAIYLGKTCSAFAASIIRSCSSMSCPVNSAAAVIWAKHPRSN